MDQLNEREVEGLEEGDAGDGVYMIGRGSQKPLQLPSTFLCCSMLTENDTGSLSGASLHYDITHHVTFSSQPHLHSALIWEPREKPTSLHRS